MILCFIALGLPPLILASFLLDMARSRARLGRVNLNAPPDDAKI